MDNRKMIYLDDAIEALKIAELGCEVEAIETLPSVPERKKGRWCFTPDGMMVCSNCHDIPTNRIIVDGSLIYDMTPINKRMKFCPNCGARMEGAEDAGRDGRLCYPVLQRP